MLIKSTDSKQLEVEQLESLIAMAPGAARKSMQDELRRLQAGIRAEAGAAYLIDFDLQQSENTAVIHDLRMEINGRVAQIDHILIHRSLNVFVLETKGFHAGVKITDEGEFLRWNDFKKTFEGMPSPLAQNERHIAVLKDVFAKIEMPSRLGIRLEPRFHSLVLVDAKARIDRPRKFDSSQVIKTDLLSKSLDATLGDQSAFGMLAKMVSSETLRSIALSLTRHHVPHSVDYATRFGLSVSHQVFTKADPIPVAKQPNIKVAGKSAGHICRNCANTKLSVASGRYGYYFKCGTCNGNTPINANCEHEGHKARIRKDGQKFFLECPDCNSSTLYFENSVPET